MHQIIVRNKCFLLCNLMRINKPIGLLLLLWPTLWSLWLAGRSVPDIKIFTIFILGVFFARASGCVINDYVDRNIDGYVKRTCNRPLPMRLISEKTTKLLFIFLISILFVLVLTLNIITIILSIVGLILMCIYPFMKRYIDLPQLVLGIAFSWSIPMVFMTINESLPLNCWLLFIANIAWTIAYDTQYAMIDKNSDIIIGIKSTAIFFGNFDKLIIGLLQVITLLLLTIIGWRMRLDISYYFSIIIALGLFCWQQILIAKRDQESYSQAFLNNNLVGMIIFVGIVLSL